MNDKKITDAGLVHLEELTELKHLILSGAGITDAGLIHLKGMTKLEILNCTIRKLPIRELHR